MERRIEIVKEREAVGTTSFSEEVCTVGGEETSR